MSFSCPLGSLKSKFGESGSQNLFKIKRIPLDQKTNFELFSLLATKNLTEKLKTNYWILEIKVSIENETLSKGTKDKSRSESWKFLIAKDLKIK